VKHQTYFASSHSIAVMGRSAALRRCCSEAQADKTPNTCPSGRRSAVRCRWGAWGIADPPPTWIASASEGSSFGPPLRHKPQSAWQRASIMTGLYESGTAALRPRIDGT